MLYIILLLILAVLLFGSGAVIGAIGYALGFIAAAIALFWFSTTYQIDPILAILIGIVGFFALCGIAMLLAKTLEPWESARIEKKMAENEKALKAKIGRMPPSELSKFINEQKAIVERHNEGSKIQ